MYLGNEDKEKEKEKEVDEDEKREEEEERGRSRYIRNGVLLHTTHLDTHRLCLLLASSSSYHLT